MSDYIKHIRHTHEEKKNTSWCGKELYSHDWTFLGIDHAAYSAQQGDRLVACKKCVAAVIKVLRERT